MLYEMRGKTKDSHLAHLAKHMSSEKVTTLDSVCEIEVRMSEAYMQHRHWLDKENPGRPYLTLIGDCHRMKGDLPFDAASIVFDDFNGIPVTINYEFSDDELADLVHKGLHCPNFETPDIFTDSVFTFDAECSMLVVKPENDLDAPLFFVDINDKSGLSVNNTCGYTLADYFEKAEPLEHIDESEFNFISENEIPASSKTLESEKAEFETETQLSEEEQLLLTKYREINARIQTEHLDKSNAEIFEALGLAMSDKNFSV